MDRKPSSILGMILVILGRPVTNTIILLLKLILLTISAVPASLQLPSHLISWLVGSLSQLWTWKTQLRLSRTWLIVLNQFDWTSKLQSGLAHWSITTPSSSQVRRFLASYRWRRQLGLGLACACLITGLFSRQDIAAVKPSQLQPIHSSLSQQALSLTTQSSIRAPLEHTFLTQGYHTGHLALDLKGYRGQPVYPIMKGTVTKAVKAQTGYGYHVVIDHGSDFISLYAHMSQIYVTPGQTVTTQQAIGAVGSTGRSTGNHLHLEIIDQGKKINPLLIIGGK